jgi:GcrA cell cycle regulator
MSTNKNPPPSAPDEDAVIPVAKRKTMTTLMPDDCRWPIGDPQAEGFHFCGEHKQAGHPYCQHHVRLAGTPSKPRPVTARRDIL